MLAVTVRRARPACVPSSPPMQELALQRESSWQTGTGTSVVSTAFNGPVIKSLITAWYVTTAALFTKQRNTRRAALHLKPSHTRISDASWRADHWPQTSRAARLPSYLWMVARVLRVSIWTNMASVSPWPNVPATTMMSTLSQESLSASMMSTGEWIVQNGVKKNKKRLALIIMDCFGGFLMHIWFSSVCTNGKLHCRSWRTRLSCKGFFSCCFGFVFLTTLTDRI